MVSIGQALRQGIAQLTIAGVEDAAFDAAQLMRLVTGQHPRLLAPTVRLTKEQETQWEQLLGRRASREPLQYICKEWDFLDFTLEIGTGVLIPRADTEGVCQKAIAAAQAVQGRPPQVVDLCSGSGAIAIGIARKVPAATVTAVELSAEAFFYLQRNAATLAPAVQCIQADVFFWQQACQPHTLDVLVANPPYLTTAEMDTLAPELFHEPRMALEAQENGLAFYHHIAKAYASALRAGGMIVFEIGATQGAAVCNILQENGYTEVGLAKDASGNPRCVYATAPL